MFIEPTRYGGAPGARDAFLDALDAGDVVRAVELAHGLVGCTNPLPTTTCAALGLPGGSTYAAAAHALIGRSSAATDAP